MKGINKFSIFFFALLSLILMTSCVGDVLGLDYLNELYEKGKKYLTVSSDGELSTVSKSEIAANAKIIEVKGNLVIPSTLNGIGVTSIGHFAFNGCSSLTSITIPDSVTSIGVNAFYGCSSLTSIAIPDSVTSIGDAAFEYCSSLTSITIPDSVTSIGDYAFYNCSSLTSIVYTGTVSQWHQVSKGSSWASGCATNVVVCSDGNVSI